MHRSIRLLAFTPFLVATLSVSITRAQTWTNSRDTPRMLDLLELDRTGEPGWPFGEEDLAGNGAQIFSTTEQRHDLRSAYVDTDSGRLWLRNYVSATNSPPDTLTEFLFVDADANASTGGPASGDELDPRLDNDPSPGGYEHVVAMPAADAAPTLWNWSEADRVYAEATLTPPQASLERGEDTDPLLIGQSIHGYVQLEIDLDLVGVNDTCGAELFIRSLSDDNDAGNGDLELGEKSECIASDANSDRIPDRSVPPDCDSNNDCPWNGLCIDGHCVLPHGCNDDSDCNSDEICSADGRCVAAGGNPCQSRADCDNLICDNGECVACVPNGDQCGPDNVCGPDGRCVPASDTLGSAGTSGGGPNGNAAGSAGITLEEGEEVTGGAFRCSFGPVRRVNGAGLAALMALGTIGHRRRSRRQRAGKPLPHNS